MLDFGDVCNRNHSRRLDSTTIQPPLSADRHHAGCRGVGVGRVGGTMKAVLRYRRIAWSALCGIACVLLIVLWVRSYTYLDFCKSPLGSLHIQTIGGRAVFFALPYHPDWEAGSRPMKTVIPWMALRQPCSGWPTPKGFWISDEPEATHVQLPFWIATFIPAALAVVPWIRWKMRFSIRTLLIVTMVIASVLGVIVYVNTPERQDNSPSDSDGGMIRAPDQCPDGLTIKTVLNKGMIDFDVSVDAEKIADDDEIYKGRIKARADLGIATSSDGQFATVPVQGTTVGRLTQYHFSIAPAAMKASKLYITVDVIEKNGLAMIKDADLLNMLPLGMHVQLEGFQPQDPKNKSGYE